MKFKPVFIWISICRIISTVLPTHFHADFVSGHLDLAAKTGAQIVYGPTAKPGFEAIVAEDNQVFEVGAYKVKVIHTPGHTMESTTYLLIDENGKEHQTRNRSALVFNPEVYLFNL